jgi:hypothetical protein
MTGLSVHMNQVHKENLTHVENANPGRQGLEIEIFGMEGVPAEIIDQHNQQVTLAHFAEEQERARVTGNPVRGMYDGEEGMMVAKRPRVVETLEEIEERANKYRTDRKNGVLPAPKEEVRVAVRLPFSVPHLSTTRSDMQQTPPLPIQNTPFYPPPSAGFPPGAQGALPPRPAVDAIQSSIDDLIAGVAKDVPEKKEKSKKDKNMRLIYNDDLISPEEKMARLPRFAEFVRV